MTNSDRTGKAFPTLLPRVGVGVLVIQSERVLLGRRIGSLGAGTWALPGGHLEFGETVEQCAIRETLEETGLAIHITGFGPYTNDVMLEEGKHYVTCFVLAEFDRGEPEIREPDKCEGWSWFAWSELPDNLFQPLQNLVALGFRPAAGRASQIR